MHCRGSNARGTFSEPWQGPAPGSRQPAAGSGTMNIRRLAPSMAMILALGVAAPARGSEEGDQASCLKRITEAVQNYTNTYVSAEGGCESRNLSRETPIVCEDDGDTKAQLLDAADKLIGQFNKCKPTSFAQMCSLQKTVPLDLYAAMLTGTGSLKDSLATLVASLWRTSTAGCPRPTSRVSKAAESCARTINAQIARVSSQIQQCVSKCEFSLTKSGGEACTAPDTGEPLKDKQIECIDRARIRLAETIEKRCKPADLVEVGCPLGASTVPALLDAFEPHLRKLTRELDVQLFHSPCRYRIAINPVPPVAQVLMEPSGELREIRCGQDLDADFFGDDEEVVFQSDLNCQDAGKVNGLVVSASDVTINLGKDFRVSGPAKSSDRTGVGILLRGGASGVLVRRGVIQRFATGITDSGAGAGNAFEQLTVRGNSGDGIRLAGEGADLDSLSVKTNGGHGVRLTGAQTRLIACTTEANGLDGFRVEGPDALLDGNSSGQLKDNGNGGFGYVVTGLGANVYSNSAEANGGGGFLVSNPTVRFKANSATSNGGPGFRFTSAGAALDSNRSEFNGGFEFDIAPGNLDETGNRANGDTITFGPEGGLFE